MELNPALFIPAEMVGIGNRSVTLLDFPIEKQGMSNLCWAAVTASVCKYYGSPSLSQKQIVAKVTGKPICATSPPVPYCNDTADLGVALNSINHLGQSFNGSLSQEDVVSYLNDGHLIGCQLYLPHLGGGHAVIIYGAFNDTTGNLMLRIADPNDPILLSMTYPQFLNNYRNVKGQWIRSYLTV
ncbi:papain-like cysteine protease family protein [Parapedobacter koreensis]|uniref:Papain-like cysteine protease AvrRpt2 n=1 Tax=Parapedobacter koreensis TaxID=332977 RepID=A0A1H7EV57_9SPHI|nr:papain-like cysteine protease family protein [Parapedobacter koreensis]SEK17711.1 Papain-like cysteine protease AvrRpt2 [Parapedobacter koreensis]